MWRRSGCALGENESTHICACVMKNAMSAMKPHRLLLRKLMSAHFISFCISIIVFKASLQWSSGWNDVLVYL